MGVGEGGRGVREGMKVDVRGYDRVRGYWRRGERG